MWRYFFWIQDGWKFVRMSVVFGIWMMGGFWDLDVWEVFQDTIISRDLALKTGYLMAA